MIYDNENAIGMGRVVGDGIYFTIVDIVVRPEYQGKKITRQNRFAIVLLRYDKT